MLMLISTAAAEGADTQLIGVWRHETAAAVTLWHFVFRPELDPSAYAPAEGLIVTTINGAYAGALEYRTGWLEGARLLYLRPLPAFPWISQGRYVIVDDVLTVDVGGPEQVALRRVK